MAWSRNWRLVITTGRRHKFKSPYDLAKLNNFPIAESYRESILNAYRAPVVVMDQNGQVVPTNDSGVVNARKASQAALTLGDDPLLKWAVSNGKEGTQPPDSTMLPDAGFYAMRGGWGGWDEFIFFRAGPPGTGHEHQEKLEVVMRVWGTGLLSIPARTFTISRNGAAISSPRLRTTPSSSITSGSIVPRTKRHSRRSIILG